MGTSPEFVTHFWNDFGERKSPDDFFLGSKSFLSVSSDGKSIATAESFCRIRGGGEAYLYLWDLAELRLRAKPRFVKKLSFLQFFQDKDDLLVIGGEGLQILNSDLQPVDTWAHHPSKPFYFDGVSRILDNVDNNGIQSIQFFKRSVQLLLKNDAYLQTRFQRALRYPGARPPLHHLPLRAFLKQYYQPKLVDAAIRRFVSAFH